MTLGPYYMDYAEAFTQIANGLVGPMDADGIPLADYDRVFHGHPDADPGRRYGVHYTPVTIAEYALGAWSLLHTAPSDERRAAFLRQADWFVANLRESRGFGVWLHEFAFPIYRLEPPWVSAMAQGQGISVLLRAAELTGDERYRVTASRAFGAFAYDVDAGGVASRDGEDVWLEEYPTRPRTHVLNGFIYALWGVLDMSRATGSADAAALWESGVATLARHIDRYEMAYWSRYDLLSVQIAAPHYHDIHVRQLAVMAALTGDARLRACHDRWRRYQAGAGRWRRLALKKSRGLLRRIGVLSRPPVEGIRAVA